MNIMFASHTYMGGPFVVGSHHLAREMEKLGHSVMHISTPLTPFHLLKWNNPEYRDRFDIFTGKRKDPQRKLVNAVPMSWIPWKVAGPLFQKTGRNWMLPSVRSMMKAHGMDSVDLLLIDQPSFVGLDHEVGAKITVYRPTDLYSKMTGSAATSAAEAAILSRAHALVSTSDPVLAELKGYNPAIPSMVLENGVEFEHFAQAATLPEDLSRIPSPRAIYVGAIDDRLDLEALRRLAEEQPEVSVVIIGPYTAAARAAFAGCDNVYLLGAKDYATIPGYLHQADVALLPLSSHSANRGRSPMKLYEYAAAGLPVVVTETPELLRRSEPFLHFYRSGSEFPRKVKEALQSRPDKEFVRGLAKRHAWDAKAAALLDFVQAL